MNEFRTVRGFEEVWRVPGSRRASPETVLAGPEVRARLARLVARTPEVLVKITGRTRDAAHLQAHLSYITRRGALPAEEGDGLVLEGGEAVRDLAADWGGAAAVDPRRRCGTPVSVSLVLSMPAGVDPLRLRDAGRAFAEQQFGERFDWLMVLHTDAQHPHLHLAVRALGRGGERLNPRRADLAAWREAFARALRDRGVPAEATPRRARGVIRKAERGALRRIRSRWVAGQGPAPRLWRDQLRAAATDAAGLQGAGDGAGAPWARAIASRQARVRALYLAQARLLQASQDAEDRALGLAVLRFLAGMRSPDTEREALARTLRGLRRDPGRTRPGRDR